MNYFMGIDLGTSSVKTLIVDENGKYISSGSEDYQFDIPQIGFAEQEPEVWWKASLNTIKIALLKANIDVKYIKGISFSGQMHGLVVLDKAFKAIRPAILHCDTRSTNEVNYLNNLLGNDYVRNIIRNPMYTGFMLPSLLWIKNNEPYNYSRISKICSPKDYIKYKLSGELSTDYSDAGATLLLDLSQIEWNFNLFDKLGINKDWLCKCVESTTLVGGVSYEAANLTGLLHNTPIYAGGGDHIMQRLGNGGYNNEYAILNMGSGGQISFYSDKPLMNEDLNTNIFLGWNKKTWIECGAIMSAGLSLKWWKNIINASNYDEINNKIENVEIGSNGIIFLPYLTGERSPHMNSDIGGIFAGINIRTDSSDMTRAVMEGVTFALYECYEICKNLGLDADALISSGGGAKSKVLRKIQSDIFGLPVKISEMDEQACLGACICGAVGSGNYNSVEEACKAMVKISKYIVEPNEVSHSKYMELFDMYKELYRDTKYINEKMTRYARLNY